MIIKNSRILSNIGVADKTLLTDLSIIADVDEWSVDLVVFFLLHFVLTLFSLPFHFSGMLNCCQLNAIQERNV